MPPVECRDDLITILRNIDAPDDLVEQAVEAYSLTLPPSERMDVVERYHDPDLKPIVRGVVYVVVHAVVAAQVIAERDGDIWTNFFNDTVKEVGRVLLEDDAVLRDMASRFLKKLREDALADIDDAVSKTFEARLDAVEQELS